MPNVKKVIALEKSFASQYRSTWWSYKNKLKPHEVYRCTAVKYWFNCDACKHVFDAGLDQVVRGTWCPFCSGNKICNDIDCIECYEKSFASCKKSNFWSNENLVDARDVFKSSKTKYLFDCYTCGHEFKGSPDHVSRNVWCPFCSSTLLCDNIECIYCYNKSFQFMKQSKFWSNENLVDARSVFKTANTKYLFDCYKCGHEFKGSLNSISRRNSWCTFCSSTQMCDDIECIHCYNKSFQSMKQSKFWSNENLVDARNVFKNSAQIFLFDCNKCGSEFKRSLCSITSLNTWCPNCINKTEQLVFDYIKQIYNNTVRKFSADWCKNKRHLPFDIVIPNLKIIIELDGIQHFKQVSNWQSPEETQKIDVYKMNCAIKNGYSVIRILQLDVYHNKYNWKQELINTINGLINKKDVCVIYMCKKNEYNVYKQYPVSFVSIYKT